MKKLAFMVAIFAGLVWVAHVGQREQAERNKIQTMVLLNDVRELAAEDDKGQPTVTPTPHRGTLHVTQRVVFEDPGILKRVLELLRDKK